jgi:hypothetical protein
MDWHWTDDPADVNVAKNIGVERTAKDDSMVYYTTGGPRVNGVKTVFYGGGESILSVDLPLCFIHSPQKMGDRGE